MQRDFSFTTELWEWPARKNWFFVSVPAEASAEIADQPRPPAGFDSVRVRARVGATLWTTSIFPNSDTGRYSLPIKKSVRTANGIELGDEVAVSIELVD